MKTYYKWLADGEPIHGRGRYVSPGEWQPRIEGELEMCERGYHVLTRKHVADWCGTELIEVEVEDTDVVEADLEKTLVRSWRETRRFSWTRKDMVAYAKWCASRAATADAARCSTAAEVASARWAAANAEAAARYAAYSKRDAAPENERREQLAWIEARIGTVLRED